MSLLRGRGRCAVRAVLLTQKSQEAREGGCPRLGWLSGSPLSAAFRGSRAGRNGFSPSGPGLGLGAGEVGEGSFLGLHRACDPQSWGQAEREHRTSEVPSSGTVKLQRTGNFKCWICTCTRGYWILAGEA